MSWPPKSDPDLDAKRAIARRAALVGASKPRKKRDMREQRLQIQIADFLRIAAIPPARWWFCPNGGNLSKAQRANFQKMGLTPGVSDLHFTWLRRTVLGNGRWESVEGRYGVIELKADDGKLSDDQIAFLADIRKVDHHAAVCRSLNEVVVTLTLWGFPLRQVTL